MFEAFPKMSRLYRDIVITEKLDGTNAQIFIRNIALENEDDDGRVTNVWHNGLLFSIHAGSRTRYITPDDDNFGFAAWVKENAEQLVELGPGRHFGEWWGRGIQRGYGLEERRFSLFNTSRWYDEMDHKTLAPACCNVVPLLYKGPFDEYWIKAELEQLRLNGSRAAPGFMDPEGIVTFHTAAGVGFKTTIKNDEKPKGA